MIVYHPYEIKVKDGGKAAGENWILIQGLLSFRIKPVKALKKSLKELFTSNKNRETETKRVLGDLKVVKVTNNFFMFLKKLIDL